jgi:hypothetical protein
MKIKQACDIFYVMIHTIKQAIHHFLRRINDALHEQ